MMRVIRRERFGHATLTLGAAAVLLALAGCVTPLPPGEVTLFDGTYAGVAEPTDPNLPDCGDPMRISGFVVRQGELEFGPFRATIASDRTVQADNRGVQLTGRFAPGTFDGQLLLRPVCLRIMHLTRQ